MAAAVVAIVAIMFAVASRVSSGQRLADSVLVVMTSMGVTQVAVVVIFAIALAMLVKLALDSRRVQNARHSVLHVSSEASDKEDISGTKSIEHLIGEKLPKHLLPSERQRRVIAMLKAAGFQMYNQETGEPVGNPEEYIRDKLKYGALSGGQRHLMYVLRNLAAAPDVLVCDELRGGLYAFRQPRVLHMLRRMKEEMHTSILYISTELSQLRLISDDIGYLSGGVICELGPAEALLDGPKHPHTKEYVSSYRSLPGCHVIGGKLAENYTALLGDADIEGEWLPA
jgi:ABC-type glutathione transport system ATPase component